MCFHHEETTDHMMQCNHCHRQVVKDNLMTNWGKYFIKQVRQQLCAHVSYWDFAQAWFIWTALPSLHTIVPNASLTLTMKIFNTTLHTMEVFSERQTIHPLGNFIQWEPNLINIKAQHLPISRRKPSKLGVQPSTFSMEICIRFLES